MVYNLIFCIFHLTSEYLGVVGGRNVPDPVPSVFLRIMLSLPKCQNSILLGIKATIFMHKNVSSVMLLEAGVRKPGSNWLKQQRNLLSHITRSPEVIQVSGLLDLVT